ncbi:hypothetical protein PUNSTDRAFT_128225 [Punctularia strigosozonata HHB-11173 SS5]|uniref:NEDD8-activating enzyme E1 regulatory subunit n=1 Tax=Punctularia strigosozonata (strain HHB-11173) TaxID=741275 RepID=R7S494_PUNST|nr:uncharacterized protein PUNSTDRAFT_128225 [Punctularia strigosozonata HHB-11173 SS5]EIN04669.1 hypothetical protein PUNSTDRAFT_128225 [Punctularia strigosozonata HHB-11173 SS5]
MSVSADQAQDIETATTAIETDPPSGAPDAKTRRYDRQLRLWASSGQSALESASILVIGASATATSIIKNLVLPGVGSFTILDPLAVAPADAGNNFFLDGQESIGKNRAQEAVPLLQELNDGVVGKADTRDIKDILATEDGQRWLRDFTLVIAVNTEGETTKRLSQCLWEAGEAAPTLIVVTSAGLISEFYIQFREHHIIESHSESSPSLRIDKPFPALLQHAMSLDFSTMDPTEHGHVPYVIILVRVLEDWKKEHDGTPPKTYAEKQEFKARIRAMKVKQDEENFDEAEAQAYRAWTETTASLPDHVPSDIKALFDDPALAYGQLTIGSPPFLHLLDALKHFVSQPPYTLPLTSTLPDMKADTTNYIHLQKLYKTRAEEEKKIFRGLVRQPVDEGLVDSFVRNCHAVKLMRGKPYGTFDLDQAAIANALAVSPKETVTHLALSALSNIGRQNVSVEALTAEIQRLAGPGVELPEEELDAAVGEVARAPTADLPNVAAFLGGLVAQETIKMITKQYVPVNGYCVADLVDTWTGVVA